MLPGILPLFPQADGGSPFMALNSHLGCFWRDAWWKTEVVMPLPYRKPQSVPCNYLWAEQGCSCSTGTLQWAYVTWEGRQCQGLHTFQEAQILEILRKTFVSDLSPEDKKKKKKKLQRSVVYLLQLWNHAGWEQADVLGPASPASTLPAFVCISLPCLVIKHISTSFFVCDRLCRSVNSVHEGNCLSSIHFLWAYFFRDFCLYYGLCNILLFIQHTGKKALCGKRSFQWE